MRDQPAAVSEQHHHVDPGEEAHGRTEQAHPPEDALLLREHGVVAADELRPVLGFAAEALGHGHALDALGEIAHHDVGQLAISRVFRLDVARKHRRRDPQQRRGRQARQGQADVQAGHVGDVDRQRNDHDEALDEHLVEEHAHRLHVTGHPVDDGAG